MNNHCKKHKHDPSIKEYAMVFSERERCILISALRFAKSTMQKNLLTGVDAKGRSCYAERAHEFHVLEGYVSSFGLTDVEWAEDSAFELWFDNGERERFF